MVGELISYGNDNLFSKLVSILDNHLDNYLIRYRIISSSLITIIILSLIIQIIINITIIIISGSHLQILNRDELELLVVVEVASSTTG